MTTRAKSQKILMVFAFLMLLLFKYPAQSIAQSKLTFKVKTNQAIAKIPFIMWGVFFEDISFGADGGIYPEMIENWSFEFGKPLMGWTMLRKKAIEGELLVVNRKETDANNLRFQIKKKGLQKLLTQ